MKKIVLLPLVLLLAGCGKTSGVNTSPEANTAPKVNIFAIPIDERAEFLCGKAQSHLDRTARNYEQFLSNFSDGEYKGKMIWKSCLQTGDGEEDACVFSMEEGEPNHDWDDLLRSTLKLRNLSRKERATYELLLENGGTERHVDMTGDIEEEFIAYRDEFLSEAEGFDISECQEKIRGMSDKGGYSYYSNMTSIGAQIPRDFLAAAGPPYRGAEWDDCRISVTRLRDGSFYRHCGRGWDNL